MRALKVSIGFFLVTLALVVPWALYLDELNAHTPPPVTVTVTPTPTTTTSPAKDDE